MPICTCEQYFHVHQELICGVQLFVLRASEADPCDCWVY